MNTPEYVSLRDFYVRKISKKAVLLKPYRLPGTDVGWVAFSLFDEPSLVRAVKAAKTMAQVAELRIERWKAEELGWVKPERSPELVE